VVELRVTIAALRRLISLPVALLIGLGIHLDWHLARPMDQRLSAHLSAHWILAIPLFAGVAWYFVRRWPVGGIWPGVLTVAVGVLLGEIIEPLLEVLAGDTLADAYEPLRVRAFITYLGAGIVTLGVTLAFLRFVVRDRGRSFGSPL